MNQLVQQGYVTEMHVNGAYHYEVTDKGLEFKALMENDGEYEFQLDKKLLKNLIDQDVSYLEMFSTYVFLRESGDTDEQARVRATELKPHLVDHLEAAVVDYENNIVH